MVSPFPISRRGETGARVVAPRVGEVPDENTDDEEDGADDCQDNKILLAASSPLHQQLFRIHGLDGIEPKRETIQIH